MLMQLVSRFARTKRVPILTNIQRVYPLSYAFIHPSNYITRIEFLERGTVTLPKSGNQFDASNQTDGIFLLCLIFSWKWKDTLLEKNRVPNFPSSAIPREGGEKWSRIIWKFIFRGRRIFGMGNWLPLALASASVTRLVTRHEGRQGSRRHARQSSSSSLAHERL